MIALSIPLIFILYTLLSWMVLGPLDSISQSYMKWKARDFSSAFNIMGLLVFLACIAMTFPVEHDATKVFFILSGACCWGLTVASEYAKYPMHHYIPTISCILFGFCAVVAEFGFKWEFAISFASFVACSLALTIWRVRYRTTFIEILAALAITIPFV